MVQIHEVSTPLAGEAKGEVEGSAEALGSDRSGNNTITAVEMLRSSALVKRRGPLPALASVPPVVEVAGLPLGLVDSSVRVKLEPVGACRVVDVHVALHFPPPAERISADQELKKLRREQEQLAQQRSKLTHRLDEVLRLRPTLPPPPRQQSDDRFTGDPIQAWLGLAELLREVAAQLQQHIRRLEFQLRRNSETLQKLEERLSSSSSAEPKLGRLTKRVRIQLDRAPATTAQVFFELSYQVPGSRWYPSYELHLDRRAAKAELVMNALVAQLTGEDWVEVELSLSTADLHPTATLPSLPAWRIGRARPPDARPAWRALPDDLDELFRDFQRQRPVSLPPLSPPAIELPGRGLLAAHQAAEPTTIMIRPGAAAGSIDASDDFPREEWSDTREAETSRTVEDTSDDALVDESSFISTELPAQLILSVPAPGAAAVVPAPRAEPVDGIRERSDADQQTKPHPEPRRIALGTPPASLQTGPSDDLLAYGQLVLGGPEENARGQLRFAQPEENAGLTGDVAGSTLGLEAFKRNRELADLECLDLPVGAIAVEESAGPFAHRYPARLGAPIPSDGRVHRLTVLREEVPIQLLHRTLPLLDASVYRIARLRNALGCPLLAGPVDVFWDGDYVITTQLRTTPADGAIELALGLEPSIRVARNVQHSQREGGILAGRTVYDEEIRIELESHLDHDTTIEVIERLPVSDDRKVEIKVSEETPPAEAFEQKERGHPIRGGRRWWLTLPPRRRESCLLRYQIVLPAKSEIVGGGRRA